MKLQPQLRKTLHTRTFIHTLFDEYASKGNRYGPSIYKYLSEQLIQRLTRYTKLKSFIPGHRNLLKNNKDKDVFFSRISKTLLITNDLYCTRVSF